MKQLAQQEGENLAMQDYGICLNHKPAWENVSEIRLEPKSDNYGRTTDCTKVCCNLAMFMFKEVQERRCNRCGRTQDFFIRSLRVCSSCGCRRYDCDEPYDYNRVLCD